MRLSILIPSIPSRFDRATKLYNEIQSMCEGMDIEVLMLVDNKQRTIGEKREALKNISKGIYFMFVDDDDSLLSVKEIYEATAIGADVITFKQRCFNNDGSEFIVTFGLGNDIEHNSNGNGGYVDIKRPPFHVCAWHEKFKPVKFPDVSYGEDGVWSLQALLFANTEFFIDKILHSYNYSPAVSEASTESNEHWSNPNKNRTIVNFSSCEYLNGQARLHNSIIGGIDFLDFNEYSLLTPRHVDNPYAFKVYSIKEVRSRGYDQILWLDASVWVVKPLDPVFDLITKNGFFVEDSGHQIGQWCNDRTLDYYGITREEAMEMDMISSGFVGIDFNRKNGVEIYQRWYKAMEDGMFVGSWDDHRHDQTCLSIIIYKLGLQHLISPCGHFFAYIGAEYMPPQETAICHLQGIR